MRDGAALELYRISCSTSHRSQAVKKLMSPQPLTLNGGFCVCKKAYRYSSERQLCIWHTYLTFSFFYSRRMNNEIGSMCSLEYTDIPHLFFTPQGYCYTNVIRGFC